VTLTDRDQPSTNGKGRVPPHDVGAEEALIGACFLSAAACDALATISPNDFSVPSLGTIAASINVIHATGDPVDTVTVAERLRRLGMLDTIPGEGGRLSELQTSTPSSSNAPKYATIVAEHARARRALHLAEELQEAVYRHDDHRVADVVVQLGDHQAAGGVDELVLEDMTAAMTEDVDDLPTIFRRDGDGVCLLYPEAVNVIQSPPSIGKSWLALMAVHEVLVAGGTVLYLDYEDSPRRIVRRLLTLVPRLDAATIIDRFHYKRPGPLSPRGIAALPRLARRLNVDLVAAHDLVVRKRGNALLYSLSPTVDTDRQTAFEEF
jgi:replicative DNA helicase